MYFVQLRIELLLPDDLLTEHSVVRGFRAEISDADCSEVEILGWLYQFYISEKKDQVMARKSAVPTEDIPPSPALYPALDRSLSGRELPRPPLAAEPPRLPAQAEHALLS
jgi:hypothetical protein